MLRRIVGAEYNQPIGKHKDVASDGKKDGEYERDNGNASPVWRVAEGSVEPSERKTEQITNWEKRVLPIEN